VGHAGIDGDSFRVVRRPVTRSTWSAGDEVVVLAVALEVRGDELALGDEPQSAPPDVVERRPGEPAADAVALGVGEALGVGDRDRPCLIAELVFGDPDAALAELRLVPRLLGVVLDDDLLDRDVRLRQVTVPRRAWSCAMAAS